MSETLEKSFRKKKIRVLHRHEGDRRHQQGRRGRGHRGAARRQDRDAVGRVPAGGHRSRPGDRRARCRGRRPRRWSAATSRWTSCCARACPASRRSATSSRSAPARTSSSRTCRRPKASSRPSASPATTCGPSTTTTCPAAPTAIPRSAASASRRRRRRNAATTSVSGTFPFGVLGRAKIANETEGFVKIVAETKYDEILGVHMIGPRATELVAAGHARAASRVHGRGTDPHHPGASDDVGGGGRGGARRARSADSHVRRCSLAACSLHPVSAACGLQACSRVRMPTNVVMPQMGESVAEGTVVRWIKKVGDTVDRDEPLFEISTDKVDAEIPSPAAGVVLEIRVHEGDTVPIDTVVAVLGEPGAGTERSAGAQEQQEQRRSQRQEAGSRARTAGDASRRTDRNAGARARVVGRGRRPRSAGARSRRRWCAGSPRSTTSTSRRCTGRASAAA